MHLLLLGLNHRTAPLEVREAVAFSGDGLGAALVAIQRDCGADEVVIVSTCNRTEIYMRAETPAALDAAEAWLCAHAPARCVNLVPHLYRHADEEVARHAFRVASGIDSMVLGEPQILGQVKQAVRHAADAGTLGGALDRLFQRTFAVAKEVRARTEIGEHSVSMGAAAVGLARQLFGDLSQVRLLLIGAGDMIERIAVHFAAQAPREIAVANRTLGRGEALARRIGGQAMTLGEVPRRFHEFDAVVSCTASMLPIIGKGMAERALRQRKRRPMFMLDLAVPRDIEAEVADLPDVFLHTVDSLAHLTQANSRRREEAIAHAEAIIERRVVEFADWIGQRRLVPMIRRMRSQAEHDREIELARARKMLARGDDPLQVLEALGSRLTNKLLHPPMNALNRAPREERDRLARTFESLYLGAG